MISAGLQATPTFRERSVELAKARLVMWVRILPFAVFMGFIGLNPLLSTVWDDGRGGMLLTLWAYPIKTVVVGSLLLGLWSRLEELKTPLLTSWSEGATVVGVGVLVYLLWVRMDWPWAIQGELKGYDPFQAGEGLSSVLAGFRIFGATVVVPIMEEVFWRSFLIRWIINVRFEAVPLGTFSLGSFFITVGLFGLEHELWLAGMMAGAAYTALLYQTRRIWPCILAHGLTNGLLGLHVLLTHEWRWW